MNPSSPATQLDFLLLLLLLLSCRLVPCLFSCTRRKCKSPRALLPPFPTFHPSDQSQPPSLTPPQFRSSRAAPSRSLNAAGSLASDGIRETECMRLACLLHRRPKLCSCLPAYPG
ncbi:hypothetical protein BKA80DRAFT_271285 [Phyllosticta citrichinensis]